MKKFILIAVCSVIAVVALTAQYFSDAKTLIGVRERGVLTKWGEVQEQTYSPGVMFKIPYSENWGNNALVLNVEPKRYEYSIEIRTKEAQKMNINCALLLEVEKDNVHNLVKNYSSYDEYQNVVIRDIVQITMRTLSATMSYWQFVGKEFDMAAEALEYILNDQLMADNLVSSRSFKVLRYSASPEFESLIEQEVLAVQGKSLEIAKAALAKEATQRVAEEAKQAYLRLEAEAKAMKLKADALQGNPYVAQYELAKRMNISGSLPQTLTLMGDAATSNLLPIMPIGK